MDKWSVATALGGLVALLVGWARLATGKPSVGKEPYAGTVLPGSISRSPAGVSQYQEWESFLAWSPPDSAAPYLYDIFLAETARGIPAGLLGALLQRESDFNPNAYNASSGAEGIAQIVPRWHPDAGDPYNPTTAIPYAAKYLRSLFDRFGDWQLALAAYNWGPTNLANKGLENAPAETRNYVAWISSKAGIV